MVRIEKIGRMGLMAYYLVEMEAQFLLELGCSVVGGNGGAGGHGGNGGNANGRNGWTLRPKQVKIRINKI